MENNVADIADIVLAIFNQMLSAVGSAVRIQAIHGAHPWVAVCCCGVLCVIAFVQVRTRHTRILRIGLVQAHQRSAWQHIVMIVHGLCAWGALLCGVVMLTQCTMQIALPARPRPALYVVLDVSKSMTNPPSAEMQTELHKSRKLDIAKHFAEQCIDALAEYNGEMGLLCFSGEALTVSPLTHDMRLLRFLLADIDFGMLPDGTALHKALRLAIARVQQAADNAAFLQPRIIMFTDGLVNTASESTEQFLADASMQNISIDIVHIVSEQDKADTRFTSAQSVLTSLARATGTTKTTTRSNAYWQNPTEKSMSAMLRTMIATQLSAMVKTPMTTTEIIDCSALAVWGVLLCASMYAIGHIVWRIV